MRPIQCTVILLLSLGAGALADNQSDRLKLIGSWEMQGAEGNGPASTWTFLATGNALRVTELDGNAKIADFECSTGGPPCEVKVAGKKTAVSIWFYGPQLVEMVSKVSEVLIRSFTPKDVGMVMEFIPIVRCGKTVTFQFKRVQLSALGK